MICKCFKGKLNLIKGRHQKFSNQKKAVTRDILKHFDDIFFPEEDIHFLSPKLEPEMKENLSIGTLFGLKNELFDNPIVITGFPLDTSKTNIGGARFGPSSLRKYSNQKEILESKVKEQIDELSLKHSIVDIGPWHSLSLIHLGDIAFLSSSQCKTNSIPSQMITHCLKILESKSNTKLFSIGGDHYISYPILLALKSFYNSPITILHFDAHHDTISDDNPNSLNHATMFYHAINSGTINTKNSIQVGVRERDECEEYLKYLTCDWIKNNGVSKTIEVINQHLSLDNTPIYLTFDIDCLDPTIVPGTGTPMKNGLFLDEILEILNGINKAVIGADIVEYSPEHDRQFRTANVVAQLVYPILKILSIPKEDE